MLHHKDVVAGVEEGLSRGVVHEEIVAARQPVQHLGVARLDLVGEHGLLTRVDMVAQLIEDLLLPAAGGLLRVGTRKKVRVRVGAIG